MSWKIQIERGNLGFSSAHFITFEGECEPLHGHNYGVRVEVEGDLTPDSYVLDFIVLKHIVRALCKRLDHLFLLPLHNPHLTLVELEDAWDLTYSPAQTERQHAMELTRIHYVLPKSSVVALPIDNATAERLAQVLAGWIAEELRARGASAHLRRLTVGVEETEMQAAFYTQKLGPEEGSSGPRTP